MKNKKGFTLVEMIVVVAIIGVLAAIITPIVMGYVRKSRQKACNADAKSIFTHLASYTEELHFNDDTDSLKDGIYYYGTAVSGASNSPLLDAKIKEGADSLKDGNCVLVKFTNGEFPKIVVASNIDDQYYGCYPNTLNGEQEAYRTGGIKKLNGTED